MEACYSWVQNLVFFFLFMSVIDHLLPEKNYQKYIRLFAGTVLILLALKPLTGGLRLEEAIARAYESLVFQYQADDLQEDLLGIEAKRLEQMIHRYEEAVAVDVEQMGAEEKLNVQSCQVTIDGDDQSETYGRVIQIQAIVAAAEVSSGNREENPVEPIAPVEIGETREEPETAGAYSELSGRILRLRRRIETYYDLEEQYVEIQMAKGEG